MPRRIRLDPHLTTDELKRRYRAAKELHERSWYQILWLLATGQLAREIAEGTGYSRYWIGQVGRRYTRQGPEGMVNRQYTHSHRAPLLLWAEHLWPLTNTVLVNTHFASIEDLEEAQAARCVALQARPDLVRSATLFHWWPKCIANDKTLGEINISRLPVGHRKVRPEDGTQLRGLETGERSCLWAAPCD